MRRFIDIVTTLTESLSDVEAYLESGKVPPFLSGLVAEARKAGSFHEFRRDYLHDIKHGLYWHVCHDPDFTIDQERGPRDMSSMANGEEAPGKLMVTSDLEHWAEEYRGDRDYVALIDMSAVPRSSYRQINRGFGNEFFVEDPSAARVLKVMTIRSARRAAKRWAEYLPQNDEQLQRFYELATRKA